MDVTMIKSDLMVDKFHRAKELSLCPECGAVMNEQDRLIEGLYTYIWLECSKSDCDGQWMQKKPTGFLAGV
jgi:hypothetical protein